MADASARTRMAERVIMWEFEPVQFLRKTCRGVATHFDEHIVIKLSVIKEAATGAGFRLGAAHFLGRNEELKYGKRTGRVARIHHRAEVFRRALRVIAQRLVRLMT